MTCGSYCSLSVNNLNDVCKKDQIDHNLQKLWPFWKNKDQTEQSLQKLGPIMYLSLTSFIIIFFFKLSACGSEPMRGRPDF